MTRPNVILVGGPPGAGKTTLARTIAGRLGFLATTVDDLVSAIRIVTTPDSHPSFHQGHGQGHIAYFTESTPKALIDDAMALSNAMWPVLERIIARHVGDAAPIVFDWWLFTPESIASLDDQRVASIWLHVEPSALWERERRLGDFYGASPDPARMLETFMERSLWRNRTVEEQARAHGLPVLHQPGDRSVDDLCREALEVLSLTAMSASPREAGR